MDINSPNDTCAACGKLRSDLPIETLVREPEDGNEPEEGNEHEVQRFALHDSQRGLNVCSDDLELYNEVEALANQVPMLRDLPDLMEQLQVQVDKLDQRGKNLYIHMVAPA